MAEAVSGAESTTGPSLWARYMEGLSVRVGVLRSFQRDAPVLAAVAVLFVLAEALLPNLMLVTMGRAVGDIPDAVRDGLSSAAGGRLTVALVIAGICYALSMLRGPGEDLLSTVVGSRLGLVMRRRLVAAVSEPVGIAHLEDPRVLDQLASAQGELLSYQPTDAPMTMLSLLGGQLSGVLACVVLGTFHWWLGIAVFVGWLCVRAPLRALVRARGGLRRKATEPLRRSWYLLGLAWRPAAGKEIRVFGLGDWLVSRHTEQWLAGIEPTWGRVALLNRRVAMLSSVVLAAFLLAAGSLGWSAYHHEIGLRTLATMLPMLAATMPLGVVSVTEFSLETMLDAFPDLDELTRGLTAAAALADVGEPPEGMPREEIRLSGVGFSYPSGDHEVLSDLDLVLPAGESLAIVGLNGAGKTTLVTLLARLRDPTRGTITVDGRPLGQLRPRDWQRQVAVVFQDFTRYPLTASENVTLGLLGEPADAEALARAARRAGADKLVAELPRGWDTVLSPHYPGGVDLSGGQWQRLALARALYAVERGATVLVLDEPTAQLDVRAEAAFYDRFLEITSGITSVVISHRFSTVRRAHRIAVLDDGRITEQGSHEQLLARGGRYAEMFTAQAARFAAASEGGAKEVSA